MKSENTGSQLWEILTANLDKEKIAWISEKLDKILTEESGRELFLTYSLIASKIEDNLPEIKNSGWVADYLTSHQASNCQIARMYLLVSVLEKNQILFSPKVSQLIQVADTSELATFLRYLPLLPESGEFRNSAVEALRTNIATVFDAISLNNPYPASHFNDQQWNQMYLKAAFMERDLSGIMSVDERANPELARIISDYAHERWAASRKVNPLFWRPVTNFIQGALIDDMKRLLSSDLETENAAGALCCFNSSLDGAQALLKNYPALRKQVADENITWENIK